MGDQPWHGSLIAKKKLGLYAGAISKVSGERLAELLKQVVADPEIASHVAAMSARIGAEDSALEAHRAIERAIASFKYPWPMKSAV